MYRLYFHAQHRFPWPSWSMPVHSVSRAESHKQIDRSDLTASKVTRTVTFHCKDGQVKTFTVTCSVDDERRIGDDFHSFLRTFHRVSYHA